MTRAASAGQGRRGLRVQPGSGGDSAPLAESVYETLRRAICDSSYPAGLQLVQEQIASDLGVSRTPVREALMRLDREGYARRVPGRGYVVRTPSAADVDEVYQIRRNLEPLALRLAFDHLRPRDLSLLRRLDGEMLSPAWSSSDYHESNRRFHQALIDRCPNRLLVRMIEHLWDLPVMLLISHDFMNGYRDTLSWRNEHASILDAIENDDVALAVRRLEEHLTTGLASRAAEGRPSVNDSVAAPSRGR